MSEFQLCPANGCRPVGSRACGPRPTPAPIFSMRCNVAKLSAPADPACASAFSATTRIQPVHRSIASRSSRGGSRTVNSAGASGMWSVRADGCRMNRANVPAPLQTWISQVDYPARQQRRHRVARRPARDGSGAGLVVAYLVGVALKGAHTQFILLCHAVQNAFAETYLVP